MSRVSFTCFSLLLKEGWSLTGKVGRKLKLHKNKRMAEGLSDLWGLVCVKRFWARRVQIKIPTLDLSLSPSYPFTEWKWQKMSNSDDKIEKTFCKWWSAVNMSIVVLHWSGSGGLVWASGGWAKGRVFGPGLPSGPLPFPFSHSHFGAQTEGRRTLETGGFH